jgi:hypothetical protein
MEEEEDSVDRLDHTEDLHLLIGTTDLQEVDHTAVWGKSQKFCEHNIFEVFKECDITGAEMEDELSSAIETWMLLPSRMIFKLFNC